MALAGNFDDIGHSRTGSPYYWPSRRYFFCAFEYVTDESGRILDLCERRGGIESFTSDARIENREDGSQAIVVLWHYSEP